MANVTTDTETIAKCIASTCYGNSTPGQGSYFNPECRSDNCVFVSLACLLSTTAPELSRDTGIPQPDNGSGGMSWQDIEALMNRTKDLGMVQSFAMSDVPFVYNGLDVDDGGAKKLRQDLVLYRHPPGPDGIRYGHCVVGGNGLRTLDYQHCEHHTLGRNVDSEVFPNGPYGQHSIEHTIMIKAWFETE